MDIAKEKISELEYHSKNIQIDIRRAKKKEKRAKGIYEAKKKDHEVSRERTGKKQYLNNFLHMVKILQNWGTPLSQRIKKHYACQADKYFKIIIITRLT